MSITVNDNIKVNAPKILDDRYSVGGVTPYASVAAANAAIPIATRAIGLTVNIAGAEYWYAAGITNLDLIVKSPATTAYATIQDEGVPLTQRTILDFEGAGVTAVDDNLNSKTVVTIPIQPAYSTIQDEGVPLTQRAILDFAGAAVTVTDDAGGSRTLVTIAPSSALPIVHYVYLVENASDASLMGGTASHVYTTFQTAYTAADTLSAGGTVPVVIVVGKTSAAGVGDIILTADWNNSVSISGLNDFDSVVGNIIGSNGAASAYSGIIVLNNVYVTSITAQTTGVGPFDGPEWDVQGSNFTINVVSLNLTNAANNGSTAIFSYQTSDSGSVINTISAGSANTTSPINGVYISVADVEVGDININGADGTGTLTLTNVIVGGAITLTQSATSAVTCNVMFNKCTINTLNWTQGGGSGNNFITNSFINTFTYINATPGSPTTLLIWNSSFNSNAGGIFNTTSTAASYLTMIAENCTFDTIKNLSAGTKLNNCTIFGNIQAIGSSCSLIKVTIQCGSSGSTAAITSAGTVTVTVQNIFFNTAPNTTVTFNEKAPISRNLGGTAKNVTATLTAAELITGYITSTTAAPVSLTMPTATALAQALQAGAGMSFIVPFHNTGGANTLTIVASATIAVPGTIVITGSNTLTVAPGEVGLFRIVFTSGTAAKLFRIS